jgi:hypothetical protein
MNQNEKSEKEDPPSFGFDVREYANNFGTIGSA